MYPNKNQLNTHPVYMYSEFLVCITRKFVLKLLLVIAHNILILIAYAQKPSLHAHAAASIRTRFLKFGLSLHPYPYFIYAGHEVSHEHSCSTMR